MAECPTFIPNSTFSDHANFNNASFSEVANFNFTTFRRGIYSKRASFGKNTYFNKVTFDKNAYFNYANFSNNSYFNQANFDKNANFEYANFGKNAHFNQATFGNYAIFEKVSFSEGADFDYASFGKNAYFNQATFDKNAYFKHATFSGHAFFRDANFSKIAYFNRSIFSGDAYFRDANFNDSAAFQFAKFDSVNFYNTKFSRLDLYEADFKTIKVDKWDSLKKINHSFDGPTYVKLIKSFREMEQFDDADAAYIKYRQVSEANKKWSLSNISTSLSKLGDIIMGPYCGYGVMPWNAIVWGILIIFGFSLVYKMGGGIKRLKENDGDDNRVTFFDAFYFSMVTFTTVGFGNWYPVGRYRILVIIEGLLGWLTLALFLVTLANVTIRP